MSSPAVYRFLPWSRRGLVAELRDSAARRYRAAAVPRVDQARRDARRAARAAPTTTAAVAGPGDVVGIDLERDRAHDAAPGRVERRAQLPRRGRLRRRRLPVAAHAVGRRTRMGQLAAVARARRRRGPARASRSRCPAARRCRSCTSSRARPASCPTSPTRGPGRTRSCSSSEGSGAEAAPVHAARRIPTSTSRACSARGGCGPTRAGTRASSRVRRGRGPRARPRARPRSALAPAWTDQDAITLPALLPLVVRDRPGGRLREPRAAPAAVRDRADEDGVPRSAP